MRRNGPDSFNSWLVAMVCAFISMVIYAVVRISGVLFVATMSRFNVDRQQASMPYILTDVIQAFSSPVTGYLAFKFGVHRVITFGCLLAAIGTGACFFAEDIGAVNVLWGIVFGAGFGLSCPLLAIIITQHFMNKRALAMGVVYVGGYAGFSTLPFLAEYLIKYYGLSGTFLFLSGLILHCVPASMLLRKPNFSIDESKITKETDLTNLTRSTPLTDVKQQNVICEYDSNKKQFQEHETDFSGKINNGFELEISSTLKTREMSKVPEVRGEIIENTAVNHVVVLDYESNFHPERTFADKYECVPKGFCEIFNHQKESFRENKMATNEAIGREVEIEKDEGNSPTLSHNHSQSPMPSTSFAAFKVFLEPIYLIVLISEALFEGTFIAFLTIIIDFSMDIGLPLSDGKYVIIGFSIASNIGLLSFGWVTDDGHMTLTNFGGLLYLFRTITTALIPFSNGLPVLLVLVMIQGLCESPVSNIIPLIIAEHYSEEVQEVAISCRLFLCAPVYLVTPWLIGYFRDGLKSYSYLFYLISFCSLICSILLFMATRLSKFRCGRNTEILRNKN